MPARLARPPRSIESCGMPSRATRIERLRSSMLPRILSPESLANRLLDEPDPALRRSLAAWLGERADERALPALSEALRRESDPEVSRSLRTAVFHVENRDRCILESGFWDWRSLGHVCWYRCRGVDLPVNTDAWRAVLPCAATVSRGRHFVPRVSRTWLIPVLLVAGADALLRRGLVCGLWQRRARAFRRTARGREAISIGLAWCVASLLPFGVAFMIWLAS